MKKFNKLPLELQNDSAKEYYNILKKKIFYRFFKRSFDAFTSSILLLLLFLPCLIIGLLIVLDSKGGPLFIQRRVGRYNKEFKILKFRTMRKDSENGKYITCKNDSRITKIGKFLRVTHLDEMPQLINVLLGQMSFVGTRPEVRKFVDMYTDEMYATLYMRPGITSSASVENQDEAKYMEEGNADQVYKNIVLPMKMKLNLLDIKASTLWNDFKIMIKTVI